MSKSFYHYVLKFRASKPTHPIAEFANAVYDDLDFPKHSTDYYEVTNYLELNGSYVMSMSVFDEAWELYKVNG